MKIRSDFVTNSSSSSFIVQININLKNGESIDFNGMGGSPESGRIDYFENDCIIRVSPKQLGNAASVAALIELLTNGIVDGCEWGDEEVKIFEKSNPQPFIDYNSEDFDPEDFFDGDMNPEDLPTCDAYDFIKAIMEKVHTMDDIKSIRIFGEEHNYIIYSHDFLHTTEKPENIPASSTAMNSKKTALPAAQLNSLTSMNATLRTKIRTSDKLHKKSVFGRFFFVESHH